MLRENGFLYNFEEFKKLYLMYKEYYAVRHVVFSRFMSNCRRNYELFFVTIIAGLCQDQGPFIPELPQCKPPTTLHVLGRCEKKDPILLPFLIPPKLVPISSVKLAIVVRRWAFIIASVKDC